MTTIYFEKYIQSILQFFFDISLYTITILYDVTQGKVSI